MKMSDYFYQYDVVRHIPLNVHPDDAKQVTSRKDLKLTIDSIGDLTAVKILAIEHAVNNHDALVECLSEFNSLDLGFSKDEWTELKVKTINLLYKIEDESK